MWGCPGVNTPTVTGYHKSYRYRTRQLVALALAPPDSLRGEGPAVVELIVPLFQITQEVEYKNRLSACWGRSGAADRGVVESEQSLVLNSVGNSNIINISASG